MNQGTRELENWEVRLMRLFREDGAKHCQLSLWFDVSQTVVSRICRGLAYRDAGGPIEKGRVRRAKASRLLLV